MKKENANVSPNELPHLSFSSLKLLSDCPRSWFVQYVRKEKQPAGDAAAFGSAFDQRVLARLGIKPEKQEDPVKLSDDISNAVDIAVGTYALQPQAEPWHGGRGQVPICITPEEWEVYAEMYGVESEIPLNIIGYIDMLRADGPTVEVCDLKTSTRKEWRPDWSLQLLVYALATRATVCHIHLLTRLKDGFGFHAWRFRPTPDAYAWMLSTLGFWARISTAVRNLESEYEAPANPSWRCSFCPRALECEAARLQMPEVY